MKPLTKIEYEKLWNDNFGKNTTEIIPNYCVYLKREIQLQDYLDLFIGKITYKRSNGFVNLNECEVNIGPHPFEKEIITAVKRTIKYILVAEAPPTGSTYFYDCTHLENTPYFKATCDAFGIRLINPLTEVQKINTLIALANKGVVLLDLLPFAIPFSTSFRKKLMARGIAKEFWNGTTYSIQTQISSLCRMLDSEWDLCLITPPILSCHIVGAYDAINIAPCTNGIHNMTTFKLLNSHNKRGCDHKKVATSTSGFPNAELIKVAFNNK